MQPHGTSHPRRATMGATMAPLRTGAHGDASRTLPIVEAYPTPGANQSHNAGVAGSSPAPAIAQPVVPLRDGGLLSFPAPTCATTGATTEPAIAGHYSWLFAAGYIPALLLLLGSQS